jgi:hypothetical protein
MILHNYSSSTTTTTTTTTTIIKITQFIIINVMAKYTQVQSQTKRRNLRKKKQITNNK